MTSFVLKIIAIIAMLFDHTGYLIYDNISWCNIIGRIAFPLFAFQLIQGYTHTKNVNKYLIRLLIFACISQIPFSLYFDQFSSSFELNVFFTLLLGLFIITICDKIKEKNNSKFNIDMLLIVLAGLVLAKFLPFNYGMYGLTLILVFYFLKDHKIIMNICAAALMIAYYCIILLPQATFLYTLPFILSSLFSLCIISLYNGKEGVKTRFFYYFYPVHIFILYIISLFIK